MSGELRSFAFEGRTPVRTVIADDGEPRWVAKDVADALGYSSGSNPARLFAAVPPEWRGVNRIHTPGGAQDMLCISEQGLYFFLGRSDKPKALPFQKWLAGEVLPSIRRTGRYEVPQALPEASSLAIKPWQGLGILARLVLLDHLRSLGRRKGMTQSKAINQMVREAKANALPEPLQSLVPLANQRKGKLGARTLSRRTMYRWLADRREDVTALIPQVKAAPEPAWLNDLAHLRATYKSLAKAHRHLRALYPEGPSYAAARRAAIRMDQRTSQVAPSREALLALLKVQAATLGLSQEVGHMIQTRFQHLVGSVPALQGGAL